MRGCNFCREASRLGNTLLVHISSDQEPGWLRVLRCPFCGALHPAKDQDKPQENGLVVDQEKQKEPLSDE